jgi:hypothetical protein
VKRPLYPINVWAYQVNAWRLFNFCESLHETLDCAKKLPYTTVVRRAKEIFRSITSGCASLFRLIATETGRDVFLTVPGERCRMRCVCPATHHQRGGLPGSFRHVTRLDALARIANASYFLFLIGP